MRPSLCLATCRTREGCDKTNGLLLVAVLLMSRQLPTPWTRHAEIVPLGCHGACPCQVEQASHVRAHPSALLSSRLGCHLPPTTPIRCWADPSTRTVDLDLLRLDLCRVYRFQTATPCPISSQRRVKSAFYEQCGVQKVGTANRKWPGSGVLAVFFHSCLKGQMGLGVVQSNGRWSEL